MFQNRRIEAALRALQAENSDLRAQLLRERAQFAEERQHLLDRLLAMTNPGALREVRRAPHQEPARLNRPESKRPPVRHFPVDPVPSLRPPSPPSPPVPGTVSLTDAQLRAVASQIDPSEEAS